MTRSIDAILVPQGAEYQAVRRGWQRTSGGQTIPAIAIPAGSQPVEAFLATADLDPALSVLLMGLGGALQPDLPVGAIGLYRDCRWLGRPAASPTSDCALLSWLQTCITAPCIAGLTSDRLVARADAKQRLGQQTGAAMVDMESAPVLSYFHHAAVLRVVSDDCLGDVPDLSTAFSPAGDLQPLSLAGRFARAPRAAARLIRGSLHGLQVLTRVAETIGHALS